MTKEPFKIIRKWITDETDWQGRPYKMTRCEYEASFWDGERGRYDRRRCIDSAMPGRGLRDTAPSVSYYGPLMKALGR